MLMLPDHWVWDIWHARDDDGLHHLFFLHAPRSLGDPGLRHWHVTVGHATSSDLRDWTVHEPALAPGPSGEFDDYTTWTGSVVRRPDGGWRMFYTATNRAEDGKIQRVGYADSDDLFRWTRNPEPVMVADGAHYELLDLDVWWDEAFRDPWVFPDDDGGWHALVTARVPYGEAMTRGVIGHYTSDDLETWTAQAPVTEPVGLGQLEVPQVVEAGGRWHLVFCSDRETQSDAARDVLPGTGTYTLVGDAPTGPFTGPVLPLDAGWPACTYAGRVLEHDDRLWLLAWERADETEAFIGHVTDPVPVSLDAAGRLATQGR